MNNMKLNRRSFDFNKEIFFGELGALAGAPMFGILGALMSHSPDFISAFTVFGSIIGSSIIWLITRIHDEKRDGVSARRIARNISMFTPVAFSITLLVGYPVVFLVTHALSVKHHVTFFNSLIGEICGFLIFLILINLYRYIMIKKFNKEM